MTDGHTDELSSSSQDLSALKVLLLDLYFIQKRCLLNIFKSFRGRNRYGQQNQERSFAGDKRQHRDDNYDHERSDSKQPRLSERDGKPTDTMPSNKTQAVLNVLVGLSKILGYVFTILIFHVQMFVYFNLGCVIYSCIG